MMTPYEQAIDEELVCAHIGCVVDGDTINDARRKMRELIRWHVDIAIDERVNGGYRLVKIHRQKL